MLLRLFTVSRRVIEGSGFRVWRSRLSFVASATLVRRQLADMLGDTGSFGRHLAKRPEVVGVLVWPYVSTSWDARQRLSLIREHFATLDNVLSKLDFDPDDVLILEDLCDLLPGLRVVLDQPKWFMREGQLCLNIFVHDTRLFSLAFSFGARPTLSAFIGAIQGRDIDGVLEVYKQITSALHGMRPRDFLIEAFLCLCRTAGIERVYAVSDANRHHRSSYFGRAPRAFSLNYDEVWRERGGSQQREDFFVLPIEGTKRDLSSVPSKRRSMYRKRYELMDRFEADIRKGLRDGFVKGHRDEFAN
jgi:uncharacterized protein VirK/YbjX